MKLKSLLSIAMLTATMVLTSCHKNLVEMPKPQPANAAEQMDFLKRVAQTKQTAKFITSKMKFSVETGQQHITLTGNLKMKRDDVIQLQLMAFGFVEAGRLEFTNDYVLIMDRINKQYLKVPYSYVSFLRNSGINFNTLQALFWNELFRPGHQGISDNDLGSFVADIDGVNDDIVINYEGGNLSYSWLANEKSGIIKMANILYKDPAGGNSQLNWDYQEFLPFAQKHFPTEMNVALTTPQKEIKIGIVLKYLKNDTDWETRTKISEKYREVSVDEILRRFMSL